MKRVRESKKAQPEPDPPKDETGNPNKKMKQQSEALVKHDISAEELETLLECPVCLQVPRDFPIPQCPSGHIICKSCRGRVTSCPTCRTVLNIDLTNNVAVKMIEKIPLKCKFSVFGCEVRKLLAELTKHEVECLERTIKCPSATCGEVQLRKYEEHAKDCNWWAKISKNSFLTTVSIGFLKWDGVSQNRAKEFDVDIPSIGRIWNGEVFLLIRYFPLSRQFAFVVMMAKNPDEVDKYSAKLSISKGSFKICIDDCPILPIEEFQPTEDLVNHGKTVSIHYSMMRKFFKFEDEGKENDHVWKVTYSWSVQISKK